MPGVFSTPPDQLVENLPHVVWTTRPDGFLDYMNSKGLEHLGANLDDVTGWGWIRCVHPADVGRTLEAWGEATSKGMLYDIEYRMRTAGGEYRWHHARGEALVDDTGSITCWIGTCVDIEKWKEHELYLRSANRQIDETLAILGLLENEVPLGFALVDSNYRFVRVNEALATINGLPRAEHLGRTMESVVPHLWERIRPLCNTVLGKLEPVVNCEIAGEAPGKPGELHYWRASYHPVLVENRLLGIAVIVQEITDQRRLEQQMRGFQSSDPGNS